MAGERIEGVDKHVYYGICETAAEVQVKEVVIQNPTYTTELISDVETVYLELDVGDQLIITFANGNTHNAPTLSLFINDSDTNIGISGNSGRVVISSRIDINCNLMWEAGDLVPFLYTELNNQSYWKMHMISPATAERFGTVKIADDNVDIGDLDDQTAITYELARRLISNSDENLGLDWEYSPEEGEWGKINLTSYDTILDSAIIPSIITCTGDLINDGDGTGNSHFLKNNDDISFISSGMGMGYTYNITEGETDIVRNFIPYDPIVDNENNVRVGYGSLEAYQEVFTDENDNVIELNPSTWIYGKNIYNAIDEEGSLQIGIIDIPEDTFDPLYTFDASGATFSKLLTASDGLAVGDDIIASGAIEAQDLIINDSATINTLDVTNLNVGNNTIVELIDSRISPISVTTQAWYGNDVPTANLFVKRIKSPDMSAEKKGHFRIEGNNSCHMQWEAPIIEGYTAVGIVGYNLDQKTESDWASHGGVWECFYSKYNNMIDFAIINWRDAAQQIYVFVDLLYVKTNWR